MAEHEHEAISARTKAALAAAKARGVKLGGPKLKKAQRRGIASNKANADRFAANVLPIIEQAKGSAATSLGGRSPKRSGSCHERQIYHLLR